MGNVVSEVIHFQYVTVFVHPAASVCFTLTREVFFLRLRIQPQISADSRPGRNLLVQSVCYGIHGWMGLLVCFATALSKQ